MTYNHTDAELIEKAKALLDRGGMSGCTRDFLEDITWNGFSSREDAYNSEISRLEQIFLLYGNH